MEIRVLTWGLGALAIFLAGLVVTQHSELAGIKHQRDGLAHQLSSRQSLRLDGARHDCATRSADLFRTLGFSDNPALKKDSLSHAEEFTDHYSKQFDRCLIEISVTDVSAVGAHETIQKSIYDAYERRSFGEYLWFSSDTKKYWEQKPFQCHMTPFGKAETFCKSTGEWENYEQELMGS